MDSASFRSQENLRERGDAGAEALARRSCKEQIFQIPEQKVSVVKRFTIGAEKLEF